jgi:hypothetical protein
MSWVFSGMLHTVKLALQVAATIGAAVPGSDSSIRPAMHRTVDRKEWKDMVVASSSKIYP